MSGSIVHGMKPLEMRVVRVESGLVRPLGSWIYVWVDVDERSIVYVGGTGFDPELRAHIHLTSDDPDHGRVRATVPRYDERRFDVLAFPLPEAMERSEAKAALLTALRTRGLFDSDAEGPDLPNLTTPMLDAIYRRVRTERPKRSQVPNDAQPVPVDGPRSDRLVRRSERT